MKTDFYTKTILTIIAICLGILTFQNVEFVPRAHAAAPPSNTVIEPAKKYGLVPLNEDGSISVKLNSDDLDVTIVGVNTNDELDVNIDEIGGGYVSYGGPISVATE